MKRAHRLKHMSLSEESKGFTLVELLVVMVLTVMFSGIIMTFFLDLWGSTATLENDSETFVTRQDAGDRLREAFNAATDLVTQNGIPDNNPSNIDPGDPTGTYWLKIHAIPGTTAMPSSGTTPLLYFEAPSVTSSKTFIMNGLAPFQDNYVLYLDASTKSLKMRIIANPAASGNRVTATCPPANVSASCPADKTIASDISAASMRYFSRSGNLLDWTSITDPLTGQYIGPDFTSVEVVEVTLHLTRKSTLHGGTDTSNETIIRVAFRNG
jgi:prepilin-type N-terminal cleavage/methylation domain-containing protein